MKPSNFVLAIALCGVAFAQTGAQTSAETGVLSSGNAVQNGVAFTYETRLEPPSPPIERTFQSGVMTDIDVVHRYLAYFSERKFFGYDIQLHQPLLSDLVLRKGQSFTYRVDFRPLSIDPAKAELFEPASWTTIPLPTYPSPQKVHGGDTIALDLFTNAATGQKIVDYLHFANSKAYEIAAGDVLYIKVLHQPEVSGNLQVRPDGFVTVHIAGEVKATGLTTRQLSDAITERLAKYFGHPEVNVQVVRINSRKYYMSGEIGKPGAYSFTQPRTVMEAIIEAGGPLDFAKTKKIYILRDKQKIPFNFVEVNRGQHLEQNMQLQNGDVIVVP